MPIVYVYMCVRERESVCVGLLGTHALNIDYIAYMPIVYVYALTKASVG